MKPLASACLFFLLTLSAAADPPRVDVRFSIESPQFVAGLGTARAGVERAVSQKLLDELRNQRNFPFLEWVNGEAAAAHRLSVTLKERPAGGDVEMFLEYRGTVKGVPFPPGSQNVVYRWYDAKNADVPESVKARLHTAIVSQFANEAFRKALLGYFVSRVPLAENVTLDGHQVIVPVRSANIERSSELLVSFFAKSDGRPGTMTLRDLLDYPQKSGVLCRIKEFDFGNVTLSSGGWDDRIAQVFGASKVRDVRVTMFTYVPNWFAGSTGGSVTND